MEIVKAPHPSSGHYSAAVISNGMVYVSGQSAADPFDGIVKVEGIAARVKQSLTRIENILKEAGIDRTHIVLPRLRDGYLQMERGKRGLRGIFRRP